MSIVYIKTRADNAIIGINSSDYITGEGWTQVDNGEGDRYRHAQGCYLDLALYDDNGIANYKLVDGSIYMRSDDDKAYELSIVTAAQITALEGKLTATDYISAKIAEGAATKEEYADKLQLRQQWRDDINRLRALITPAESEV